MWGKVKSAIKQSEFLEGFNIGSFLQESLYGKFINIIQNTKLNNEILDITEKYKIPSVCVIGMESTGKSSLLENITKCAIFPRSAIICTKLCIHLKLRTALTTNEISCSLTHDDETQHINKVDILKIIENIMNKISCDEISDKEIIINITDLNIPNFDFVDIPGCRVYPEDLKEKTFSIAEKYIADKNTIIICVVPATLTRLTTYPPIAMIKKHKKELNTIIALTMCDRVQTINIYDLIVKRITNKTDELDNSNFYSCIAIINRNHSDDLALSENDILEKTWFQTNIIDEIPDDFNEQDKKLIFKSIGVNNLITNLDNLYNKIINNEWIPNTINESQNNILNLQKEYEDIGAPPEKIHNEKYFYFVFKAIVEKYLYDFIINHEEYDDDTLLSSNNSITNIDIQNLNNNNNILTPQTFCTN